ncbi:MAG TPA: protein kinase, partial [Chloroflexota bacterium]|nr:protein kinase [Chloroflexota bacterium]
MTLAIGQRVGRYEVAEVLGEGGMSTSDRATDSESGADVVLKVPHAGMIGDLAAYGRYEREMDITLKLNHPNLQRALSTGHLDGTPLPFLVLEYVVGTSFRGWLRDRGQLPIDQALGLTLQVAEALMHCHEQGIVHRDLKPEN